jgi:hypothetical protein
MICNLPTPICNHPPPSALPTDDRARLPGRAAMPSIASATGQGGQKALPDARGKMQDGKGVMQIVRETMQDVPVRCRTDKEW